MSNDWRKGSESSGESGICGSLRDSGCFFFQSSLPDLRCFVFSLLKLNQEMLEMDTGVEQIQIVNGFYMCLNVLKS